MSHRVYSTTPFREPLPRMVAHSERIIHADYRDGEWCWIDYDEFTATSSLVFKSSFNEAINKVDSWQSDGFHQVISAGPQQAWLLSPDGLGRGNRDGIEIWERSLSASDDVFHDFIGMPGNTHLAVASTYRLTFWDLERSQFVSESRLQADDERLICEERIMPTHLLPLNPQRLLYSRGYELALWDQRLPESIHYFKELRSPATVLYHLPSEPDYYFYIASQNGGLRKMDVRALRNEGIVYQLHQGKKSAILGLTHTGEHLWSVNEKGFLSLYQGDQKTDLFDMKIQLNKNSLARLFGEDGTVWMVCEGGYGQFTPPAYTQWALPPVWTARTPSPEFEDAALQLSDRVLGEGGQGSICEATLIEQQRAVVFKKPLSYKHINELESEAELLSGLPSHPHVIGFFGKVISHYEFKGLLLEKGVMSLQQKLSSLPERSYPWIKKIALGVARGLGHLHQHQVVHGDLKAKNVVLTQQDEPKLIDFGFSTQVGQCLRHESSRRRGHGTVTHMAPELFQSVPRYGFAADVYAWGMLLWELMTGRKPFSSVPLSEDDFMEYVLSGYREVCPEHWPQTIQKLLKDCWASEPDQRPSMLEVVRILEVWDTERADKIPQVPAEEAQVFSVSAGEDSSDPLRVSGPTTV